MPISRTKSDRLFNQGPRMTTRLAVRAFTADEEDETNFALVTLETRSAMGAAKPRVLFQALVNAPEGCQRLFTGSKVDTAKVSLVLFTKGDVRYLSGLPGLYFQMSDAGAGEVRLVVRDAPSKAFLEHACEFANRRFPTLSCVECRDALDMVVDPNTKIALRARRHRGPLANFDLDGVLSGKSVLAETTGSSAIVYVLDMREIARRVVMIVECGDEPSEPSERCRDESNRARDYELTVIHTGNKAVVDSPLYRRLWAHPSCQGATETHNVMVNGETSAARERLSTRGEEHREEEAEEFSLGVPSHSFTTEWGTRKKRWVFSYPDDDDDDEDDASQNPKRTRVATTPTTSTDNKRVMACVLGTGASRPSPTRGLSAIHVFLDDRRKRSCLLDVGEGTLNQMRRCYDGGGEDDMTFREAMRSLEWIWISHHHLDHHGGLAALLAYRWKEFGRRTRVFAPSTVISFLRAVERFVYASPPGSGDDVVASDDVQEWLFPNAEAPRRVENKEVVGVCPTTHCVESWAVAVRCGGEIEEGGITIAYSGDARGGSASTASLLSNLGRCEVLIHEATFENALAEDSRAKRHATVGEAAHAGEAIATRALVLTHLSQRYPFSHPLPDLREAVETMTCDGARSRLVVCARDLLCLSRVV